MEFLPIRTFDSYITANIWKGKFEDAGIHCYLKDEYTVTIDPILSNAVGGIKLCVNTEQLTECRELVLAIENENRQAQRCPKCGSLDVQYISQPGNPVNWLSAITSWFLGSYAMSAKQVYHCFNCGEEFDELQNKELNSLVNS
jgi:DNA-directed RNA polymerase subunit RPC12/RpoP